MISMSSSCNFSLWSSGIPVGTAEVAQLCHLPVPAVGVTVVRKESTCAFINLPDLRGCGAQGRVVKLAEKKLSKALMLSPKTAGPGESGQLLRGLIFRPAEPLSARKPLWRTGAGFTDVCTVLL